jgi:hypothetical protein
VGRIGSLEPGKSLGIGFPFPQSPFIEIKTGLDRFLLAVQDVIFVASKCEQRRTSRLLWNVPTWRERTR